MYELILIFLKDWLTSILRNIVHTFLEIASYNQKDITEILDVQVSRRSSTFLGG